VSGRSGEIYADFIQPKKAHLDLFSTSCGIICPCR